MLGTCASYFIPAFFSKPYIMAEIFHRIIAVDNRG